MRRLWLLLGICLFLPVAASAQTASSSTRLTWDQVNATATEAGTYTYAIYVDGAVTGTPLLGVTCSGIPTVCSALFPAFTPGKHTLTLTARNAAGESPKSAPFAFEFVVVPSAPSNLRTGN